jgi:hypothetical protein
MTVAKVIRYRTKPERAEENEHLIRDVFAELAEENPEGLRYAAFRLADGVTSPCSTVKRTRCRHPPRSARFNQASMIGSPRDQLRPMP